jgi:hypothetical protein
VQGPYQAFCFFNFSSAQQPFCSPPVAQPKHPGAAMESVAEMWRWAAGLQAADEALRVGLAGRGMGGNGASDSLALLRNMFDDLPHSGCC